MLLRLIVSLMCLSLPGSGWALSCIKPNLAREFNERAADSRTFLLVEGSFVAEYSLSDLLRMPPPKPGEQPRSRDGIVRAEATFVGKHLGAETEAPLNSRVALTVECHSPWCGAFPNVGISLIGFLERTQNGSLAFHSGLCPAGLHERPSPAQVSVIRGCLAGGRCTPADIAAFE